MPSLSELRVPATRSLAEVPVPSTGMPDTTAEQKDVAAFQATAGEFRKGLRSSVNSLGAAVHAFVGGSAEAMGLTDYANERFNEAAQQAEFADAVGPRVRDYRAVKDLQDTVDFVVGLGGEAVGGVAPMAAGAAVGGLRGAAAATFIPETGQQLLRTRNAPASPQKKLGVAALEGAVSTAGSLAVPVGAAAKLGKAAAGSVAAETAKAAGTMGALSAAQERARQSAHTVVDPDRHVDQAEESAALVNAGIGGAVAGAPFGAVPALASRAGEPLVGARQKFSEKLGKSQDLPEDRTQTTDEAKAALGTRERPLKLDPEVDSLPDDPASMGDHLDAHDARVDAQLKRAVEASPEKFKDYAGWESAPEKRDALHEAISKGHADEVDRPLAKRLLDGLRGAVDKLRPKAEDGSPKRSERRTAVDLAIHDEIVKRIPDHLLEAMTPAQRLQLADDVKSYAMHTAGLKAEQPGPGEPTPPRRGFEPGSAEFERDGATKSSGSATRSETAVPSEGPREAHRVVPHELMDIFGDKLHEVVDVTQQILGKGGIPLEKPVTKAELQGAERRRAARLTGLEETVLSHLRDVHQADPETRNVVVKEMTRRLQEAVNGGVTDWKAFDAQLDYAFGSKKEAVLEAFDRERPNISRAYEDLEPRTDESTAEKLRRNEHFRVSEEDEGAPSPVSEPEANPTGEQATAIEEAHPYRDKRLGVPLEKETARSTLEALRSEYDPKSVKFRVEVNIDKEGAESFTLHAEDAEAPMGFSKAELERVQEKHGKAGHENSVVSVVRKDGERNATVAISIPNLVAETIRVTKGYDEVGPKYVRDMVMEGLSRLASDPDFVRFAKSSQAEGLNFPDDMFVAKVGGRRYTWGEVKDPGLTAGKLRAQRESTDRVALAQQVGSLEEVRNLYALVKNDLAKAEGYAAKVLKENGKGEKYDAAQGRVSRLEDALDKIEAEGTRRTKEGDFATFDKNRELGVISTEEIIANQGGEGERRTTLEDKRPVRTQDDKMFPKAEERAGTLVSKLPPEESPGARTVNAEHNERAKQMGLRKGKYEKFAEMRIGKERITPEQEKSVRDYVERVLGPHATTLFKEMDAAGSFAKLNGAEMLTVSIRALDPLGVGRHEGLHALMARLSESNPQAGNVLLNAAKSPTVVAQLRHLLADEPRALRQLSDGEERAAYMYEFWAAGKLNIGPKTEGVFGQIKAALAAGVHALFGLGDDVATLNQAEQVLRAFHDGALADKSAAGRVLDRLLPKAQLHATWVERLGDLSNRVMSTADGYIRDQRIPAFNEAADLMYNSGEGKSGLVQSRHTVRNQYMNRYALATRGLDDAAQARVLAELQGSGKTTNAAEAAAVRATRRLLDDLYDYMQEKGVKVVEWSDEAKAYTEHDLQKVPDFFPRAWDKEAVAAKDIELAQLLTKYGYDATATINSLMKGAKAAPGETDALAGLTYYAPNTMSRKLNIPEAELAPFMKKDLGSIMYDYINYTTRRGEYASRLGNQGQKVVELSALAEKQGATPEQMKSFSKYVQAMEGSLGNDIDPNLRKFFGAALTYQNLRFLPLSLFSSLIDPLGIAVRGGSVPEAFTAFSRGIRDLVSTKQDDARELARAIGAINEATEEHMVAEMYGANYGASWQKWLNDKLFRLNGMESWNNSMRTAASAAAQSFVVRHVERPTAHSERYLRELGLDPKSPPHISDGKLELTPEVVDALNRWVDGAVLRPHAGIRPIWMSDPHFMLVGHLKQFTYSFQKTINERVAHEALHGNFTPLMVLASYVPAIIGADVLRAAITPGGADDDRLNKWTARDWLVHGVNRAGISGPGQYAMDGFSDMSREGFAKGTLHAIADVGGPTSQQLYGLLNAAVGSGNMGREALRALPIVPAMGMR